MKVRIKWVQDRTFLGESVNDSGGGHTIVMDGAPEAGGRDLGVRPMETVLIGMGGCTAFDVVHILEKSREPVEDCVADITAERAEDDPKVFTKIHVKFTVSGRNLKPGKVERAVQLSAEKYCSASIMLAKTAEITHEIEIVNTAA
ncbi:MAG: OsmC family protein [Rhodospirillales bacterium]